MMVKRRPGRPLGATAKPKTRNLSPEARARISEAVHRRWANAKEAKERICSPFLRSFVQRLFSSLQQCARVPTSQLLRRDRLGPEANFSVLSAAFDLLRLMQTSIKPIFDDTINA
jgi:hypothetical protein